MRFNCSLVSGGFYTDPENGVAEGGGMLSSSQLAYGAKEGRTYFWYDMIFEDHSSTL